jgi:hypothetical protein
MVTSKSIPVAFLTMLLLIPFFSIIVSSHSGIEITIKGGFGCTLSIKNDTNETIIGNFNYTANAFFREVGIKDSGKNISIKPYVTFIYKRGVPALMYITIDAQAGNVSLEKHGISIFYLVMFLNK